MISPPLEFTLYGQDVRKGNFAKRAMHSKSKEFDIILGFAQSPFNCGLIPMGDQSLRITTQFRFRLDIAVIGLAVLKTCHYPQNMKLHIQSFNLHPNF